MSVMRLAAPLASSSSNVLFDGIEVVGQTHCGMLLPPVIKLVKHVGIAEDRISQGHYQAIRPMPRRVEMLKRPGNTQFLAGNQVGECRATPPACAAADQQPVLAPGEI